MFLSRIARHSVFTFGNRQKFSFDNRCAGRGVCFFHFQGRLDPCFSPFLDFRSLEFDRNNQYQIPPRRSRYYGQTPVFFLGPSADCTISTVLPSRCTPLPYSRLSTFFSTFRRCLFVLGALSCVCRREKQPGCVPVFPIVPIGSTSS